MIPVHVLLSSKAAHMHTHAGGRGGDGISPAGLMSQQPASSYALRLCPHLSLSHSAFHESHNFMKLTFRKYNYSSHLKCAPHLIVPFQNPSTQKILCHNCLCHHSNLPNCCRHARPSTRQGVSGPIQMLSHSAGAPDTQSPPPSSSIIHVDEHE